MSGVYDHTYLRWQAAVIPVLLPWSLAIAALSWLEQSQSLNSTTLLVMLAPLWILIVGSLIVMVVRTIWVLKTFRRHLPRLIWVMFCLFWRFERAKTEVAKVVVHGCILLAALLLLLDRHVVALLPVAIYVACVIGIILQRALLPPAVLLLTSSAPSSLQLFERLNVRAAHTGLLAMLDISQHIEETEVSVWSLFLRSAVMLADARTIDNAERPDEWQETVHALMAIVPVIIIDGRVISTGVVYETARVFNENLWPKTVFITQDDGSIPVVEAAFDSSACQRPSLDTFTESQLLRIFPKLTWHSHWTPTPPKRSKSLTTSLYEHPIYRLRNSVVPLLLIYGAIFAALTYIQVQDWVPSWLLLVLTGPAALVALLQVHHAYLRLSWAARTFRTYLPRLAIRMLALLPKLARARAEIAKILMHLTLAVAGTLLAVAYGVFALLPLSGLFVGIALTATLRIILPPGGIYLASSHPDRVRYFASLNRRAVPGIAALLEVSTFANPDIGLRHFYGAAIGILNDYRTTDPADWTYVVARLAEMTAIVVVDGRDNTPGLKYEVQRLLRNRLDFKTAFLTEDGTLPQVLRELDAKSTHPSGQFQVIPHSLAAEVVPEIIARAHAFWIPVKMDV